MKEYVWVDVANLNGIVVVTEERVTTWILSGNTIEKFRYVPKEMINDYFAQAQVYDAIKQSIANERKPKLTLNAE